MPMKEIDEITGIVVDAALGQVNIQETDKIKLFYKQK